MHVLGIDVGGTKTVCLLGDEEGRVLSTARGPGANLQTVGELQLEKVLHTVMAEALTEQSVAPAAICLGIAGVDRPEDATFVRGVMSRIGYKARILVVNDALIALQAGIGAEAGIVIVAGTGSIAYGCDRDGTAARAGGWGYVLGDEGSGYWIGRLALRAIAREADGRGQPTSLTPRVLAHFGVDATRRAASNRLPPGLQSCPRRRRWQPMCNRHATKVTPSPPRSSIGAPTSSSPRRHPSRIGSN